MVENGFRYQRICVMCVLLLSGFTSPASAQTTSLRGIVTDAKTGEGVAHASLTIMPVSSPGRPVYVISLSSGAYAVEDLPYGIYTVTAAHIGYLERVIRQVELVKAESTQLSIALSPKVFELETISVRSVSRRAEKALDAPAAISILDASEIKARTTLTPADHLKGLTALDFASTGLNQRRIVARGFNESTSGRLLILTDNRIARVPSLRFNAYQLIPVTDADIERVEVVAGPGSALYGPNAAGGVVHILTRSPLDSKGTSIRIGGGERGLLMGAVRHAGSVNESVGYKISAQYYQATDWPSSDPAEPDSIVKGVQTPTGRIDEGGIIPNTRDSDIQNTLVEGRLDIRPNDALAMVFSGGVSRMSNLEYSGIGTLQGQDWTYTFLQGRMTYKNLFAQAFWNRNDAGQTYALRSGDRLVDNSSLFVAQIQHGVALLDDRQRLTYGTDLLLTRPDTKHTIYGRNEDADEIDEVGFYVQSETQLSTKLKAILAARVDHHSRLQDPVFSPRAALVVQPEEGHHFRLTYNRAFTTPATDAFSIDINLSPTLGELPYALRLRGVPKTGWTYVRNTSGGIGGLAMQSPFIPEVLGGPSAFHPADATLMWDVVVGFLQMQDLDLSGLPPPTSDQVRTDLRILNDATFEFDPVDPTGITDIQPLKAVIDNTFEMGYKGIRDDKLLITADLYYNRIENGSATIMATPNVFFDPGSLETYLSAFLPAENAAGLAGVIAEIPLGTVTPREAGEQDPGDLMFTDRNLSRTLSLYGADLSLTYYAGPNWQLQGAYSYLSKDFFEKEDFTLNAPRHKFSGSIQYLHPESGLDARLGLRYVHGFPFFGGVYRGRVESYTVLDFTADYPLPFSRQTHLTLSVQNLLNNKHREFVGAPEIKRLSLVRISHSF